MKNIAILLAGGSGERMKAGINKVFLPLHGVPALIRAIAPFTGFCEEMIVVAREDEADTVREMVSHYGLARFARTVVTGGATRQDSVWNGLAALPGDTGTVLVHDGARALITEDVIARALTSAESFGSGVAAIPVTDTIKRAESDGLVLETLNRNELWQIQTPQAFHPPLLQEAHALARKEGWLATDDAALLEYAGKPVRLSLGDRENIKLTTPFDLLLADAILTSRGRS